MNTRNAPPGTPCRETGRPSLERRPRGRSSAGSVRRALCSTCGSPHRRRAPQARRRLCPIARAVLYSPHLTETIEGDLMDNSELNSDLLEAAANADAATVADLLDRGADIEARDELDRDASSMREAFWRLPDEIANILPFPVLAMRAEHVGDQQTALRWWRQEYELGRKLSAAQSIMRILVDVGEFDELRKFVETAPATVDATYYLLLAGDNTAVIRRADIEILRNKDLELPLINKAIAFKRLRHFDEMENELAILEAQIRSGRADPSIALQAGIAALRGVRADMMRFLREALYLRQITVDQAREFPVFEDYREDEAFQALLSSYEAHADERG